VIVSFSDYEVPPRYDGTNWTIARIQESASQNGPWTTIDNIQLPPDPDPANPSDKSFTTENATLTEGWYLVIFLDNNTNQAVTDPVFNAAPASYEILATVNDINANLDGTIVNANAQNTSLIQVSVNRVVKGYLSRVVDNATMASWTSPDVTPDIVREAAAKLIASQLYYNSTSRSSTTTGPNTFAQKLYDDGMALLNQIIEGEIIIPDVPVTPIEGLTELDYFPVDATNRAFTMGMNT
jgi:hypothetical protein